MEVSIKNYQKNTSAVIPRPKYLRVSWGNFFLTPETPIVAEKNSFCMEEARRLRATLREATGLNLKIISKAKFKGGSDAIFLKSAQKLANVLSEQEGYTIKVTAGSVLLRACTDKGLFYAAQSLIDLIQKKRNKWLIPGCELYDWPDFSWRGFMVDPAREFIPLPRLKEYIQNMARNKLNVLHLHLSDAESFTLETKSHPVLKTTTHKGYHGVYSKEEIRELVSYADEYKIQIIPEIDIPGHATQILESLPELYCRPKKGKVSKWTLCAGSEKTYQFLDQLFAEITPLFPSEFFHLGTDELEDESEEGSTSWRECCLCQELMKKEGLRNFRELFYYFVVRVRKLLKRYGKQVMVWNDNIDIAKPHDIPRDVLIHFWRIARPGCGPRRNCSLAKFLKSGFQVVNSYYPMTYINYYIPDEKLARWNPASMPPVPVQLRDAVLGGEMCAWNVGWKDYYQRVLPSAWALFGDRVWNKRKLTKLRAFARSLPRHIFGPQLPRELDSLFEVLGSLILPLPKKAKANLPTSLPRLGKSEKKQIYETMEQTISRELKKKKLFNVSTLREYLEYLRCLKREL